MDATFSQRHEALLVKLRGLPEPQARLSWIVDQGNKRPPFQAEWRTQAFEVKGCASRLWLRAEVVRGKCRLHCDSESAILRAVTGTICELYDGLPPSAVGTEEPSFLTTTGLLGQLTENRRRTVHRFLEALLQFAAANRAG